MMRNRDSVTSRRFGRVNWLGTATLASREIQRFMNVWAQTVMAPLVNAGLLVLIFALALGKNRADVLGVPFVEFILPGVMMMAVVQQSFANASSSIISAKMQGNIVDTLMPPLSAGELLFGYVLGAVARGVMVGGVITIAHTLYTLQFPAHPIWLLMFMVVASVLLGTLGLLAGIRAEKFDQLAVISNFIITPLSFLSGSFYSIETLPPVMRFLCHINPIFYVIDGGRYGLIGVSDSAPWLGLMVAGAAACMALLLAWRWLKNGYRLKA